jgi:thymidylate synthase
LWPAIKKCKNNRWGTYFRRLTAYGKPGNEDKVDQLEKILSTWDKGIRRHSAFQASVFDPYQDHRSTPYLGFPCLQQVVFHTNGSNGSEGLEVMAFYANQILLEKAYGNYLGLYRLGQFMAGEMGLKLIGITCIASHLTLGKSGTTKRELSPLVEILKRETVNE